MKDLGERIEESPVLWCVAFFVMVAVASALNFIFGGGSEDDLFLLRSCA